MTEQEFTATASVSIVQIVNAIKALKEKGVQIAYNSSQYGLTSAQQLEYVIISKDATWDDIAKIVKEQTDKLEKKPAPILAEIGLITKF